MEIHPKNIDNTTATAMNAHLQGKFKEHRGVVCDYAIVDRIINKLLGDNVIGVPQKDKLAKFREDKRQQCEELISMLESSGHERCWIYLYHTMKETDHPKWLVGLLDGTEEQVDDDTKKLNNKLGEMFKVQRSSMTDNVYVDRIINKMFEKDVFGKGEKDVLARIKDEREKTEQVFTFLESSGHPRRWIHLRDAIKETEHPDYIWKPLYQTVAETMDMK